MQTRPTINQVATKAGVGFKNLSDWERLDLISIIALRLASEDRTVVNEYKAFLSNQNSGLSDTVIQVLTVLEGATTVELKKILSHLAQQVAEEDAPCWYVNVGNRIINLRRVTDLNHETDFLDPKTGQKIAKTECYFAWGDSIIFYGAEATQVWEAFCKFTEEMDQE